MINGYVLWRLTSCGLTVNVLSPSLWVVHHPVKHERQFQAYFLDVSWKQSHTVVRTNQLSIIYTNLPTPTTSWEPLYSSVCIVSVFSSCLDSPVPLQLLELNMNKETEPNWFIASLNYVLSKRMFTFKILYWCIHSIQKLLEFFNFNKRLVSWSLLDEPWLESIDLQHVQLIMIKQIGQCFYSKNDLG